MVQWLGLLTFTPKVQSLVVELRSHKLHGVAKKKTTNLLWSLKILFSLPFHLSEDQLSVSSPLACTSQPRPNWVPCFVPNTSVPLLLHQQGHGLPPLPELQAGVDMK